VNVVQPHVYVVKRLPLPDIDNREGRRRRF
jgi:hypothetical protein